MVIPPLEIHGPQSCNKHRSPLESLLSTSEQLHEGYQMKLRYLLKTQSKV
jgi:hypothetical protein